MRSSLRNSLIITCLLSMTSLANAFHPHHGKFVKGAGPSYYGPSTAGVPYYSTGFAYQPSVFVTPAVAPALMSSFGGCAGVGAGVTFVPMHGNGYMPSSAFGCAGGYQFGTPPVTADPNFIDIRTIGNLIDLAKKLRGLFKDAPPPSPVPVPPGDVEKRLANLEKDVAAIKAFLEKKGFTAPKQNGTGPVVPGVPPPSGPFGQPMADRPQQVPVPDEFTKALYEYDQALKAYGAAAQAAKNAARAHQHAEAFNVEQAEILKNIKTSLDKINKSLVIP